MRLVRRPFRRTESERIRRGGTEAYRKLIVRRWVRKAERRKIMIDFFVVQEDGTRRTPLYAKRAYGRPKARIRYNAFTMSLYGPSDR